MRAKRRRLELGLTQQGLAVRSAVSLGTSKLFERTGRASLETAVKLAFAFVLGGEAEFGLLFPGLPRKSIDDVLHRPTPQSGRRT